MRRRDIDLRIALIGVILGVIFYTSHDQGVAYWIFGGASLFALLAVVD